MWQAALSMQLFGVSEFSIRHPSVLAGALMILLLYRIALITINDQNFSFFAASLFCFSYFQLGLISGYRGMDHNDVAFGFYILASIWAYLEFLRKPSFGKAGLVGLLAGCAILNKWLTGLLVYSAWGIHFLLSLKGKSWKGGVKYIAFSVFICVLVFLPWQLHILHTFYEYAIYEYQYNSKHLLEVVEGHKGTQSFYLESFQYYFGPYVWPLIPIGIIGLIISSNSNKRAVWTLLFYFLFILGFFSLVVATKVEAYFFIVVPIGLVFIAGAFLPLRQSKGIRFLLPAVIMALSYNGFQLDRLSHEFDRENEQRKARIHNTRIYKNLHQILPHDIDLVINTNEFEDVDIMFYNPGLSANHYWYSEERMNEFKAKGIKIAAFKSRPGYQMPGYVYRYPDLFIIDVSLK